MPTKSVFYLYPIEFNLQYQKPEEIIAMENEILQEFKKMKASKDGDVECNPS